MVKHVGACVEGDNQRNGHSHEPEEVAADVEAFEKLLIGCFRAENVLLVQPGNDFHQVLSHLAPMDELLAVYGLSLVDELHHVINQPQSADSLPIVYLLSALRSLTFILHKAELRHNRFHVFGATHIFQF